MKYSRLRTILWESARKIWISCNNSKTLGFLVVVVFQKLIAVDRTELLVAIDEKNEKNFVVFQVEADLCTRGFEYGAPDIFMVANKNGHQNSFNFLATDSWTLTASKHLFSASRLIQTLKRPQFSNRSCQRFRNKKKVNTVYLEYSKNHIKVSVKEICVKLIEILCETSSRIVIICASIFMWEKLYLENVYFFVLPCRGDGDKKEWGKIEDGSRSIIMRDRSKKSESERECRAVRENRINRGLQSVQGVLVKSFETSTILLPSFILLRFLKWHRTLSWFSFILSKKKNPKLIEENRTDPTPYDFNSSKISRVHAVPIGTPKVFLLYFRIYIFYCFLFGLVLLSILIFFISNKTRQPDT